MKIDQKLATALKNKSTNGFMTVLDDLESYITDKNSDLYHSFIINKTQANTLKRGKINGVLSPEQIELTQNKIQHSILCIISELTEKTSSQPKPIVKDILIICKIKERVNVMENLVQLGKYENIIVNHSAEELEPSKVNDYKLIIFDNFPKADKETEETLLKHYLNNTNPLLLYFGPQLDLLREYPEKAYFSNSIFSIHSRIEEMLRFDKMTNGQYKSIVS